MDDVSFANVVTCSIWVPRGAAKQKPEKVQIYKDELVGFIKESSENICKAKMIEFEEKKRTKLQFEAIGKNMKLDVTKKEQETDNIPTDTKKSSQKKQKTVPYDSDEEDIEKKYGFDNYDDGDDTRDDFFQSGPLTMQADGTEDTNLVPTGDSDSESEKENMKILSSDNLIAVGHVEGDAAILEIYVYNAEESSFYVHHDFLLPSVPLCMEWLNLDPSDAELKPGNLVAIGSMSPVIDVWDLDVMNCLEPAFHLGRRPSKKKKLSRLGHSDAVLCLAWNTELEHILASGSADCSVLLWDLNTGKESEKISCFSHRVQDVKWNPHESQMLLTASSDRFVRLHNFASEDEVISWKLDGEVECLAWNRAGHPYSFYAATDLGSVYEFDTRERKPLHKFQAHQATCTGLELIPHCPGCLVTTSEDGAVKIWDTDSGRKDPWPVLIEEVKFDMGVIHSVSSSADCPFVLSLTGNNRLNNFKVWDIRDSEKVIAGFCDRLLVSVDGNDDVKVATDSETSTSSNNVDPSKGKLKCIPEKKKGPKLKRKKEK